MINLSSDVKGKSGECVTGMQISGSLRVTCPQGNSEYCDKCEAVAATASVSDCCTDSSIECEACSQGVSVDAFCAQCTQALNSVYCDTCQAAKVAACPEVMCELVCDNGFLADENGCDTCNCGAAEVEEKEEEEEEKEATDCP